MSFVEAKAKMLLDFKKEYPQFSEEEIDRLFHDGQNAYLSLAFPYDKSVIQLPDECLRDLFIIKKIMIEIIERAGCSSMVAYQENGLSYTFSNDLVSNGVRALIKPKAGV